MGKCPYEKCLAKTIKFTYGSLECELRVPETTYNLIQNTVENFTRSHEITQAHRPNFTRLNLVFTAINEAKKSEFKNFYIQSAAEEILYLDECEDTWKGVIITPILDIEQTGTGFFCPEGNGSYTFSFDFEGVRQPK